MRSLKKITGVNIYMDDKNELTKLQNLVSEKGRLIRTVSHDLKTLQSNANALNAQITIVDSGGGAEYFLQLNRETEYEDDIAAISESDIKELSKALDSLKKASQVDVYLDADHVQNIFVTEDNFKIGYFVLDASLTWFIEFDEYNDELEYFSDVVILESLFEEAQEKIKELKSAK